MSNVVKIGERCAAPVIDAQRRAKLCRKPATTTRTVEGVEMHFCEEHAQALDAQRARVSSAERLDFADPPAVSAWLARLEGAALDLSAAAEDQVRAPGARDLGRRAARAIVAESAHSIEELIRYARAGLGDEHGDPSGAGGSPAY